MLRAAYNVDFVLGRGNWSCDHLTTVTGNQNGRTEDHELELGHSRAVVE